MFLYCVDRLVMTQVDVRSDMALKFAYLSPEAAAIYQRADFIASQLSTNHPAGLNIRLIGDPTHVADWITNNKIQVNGQAPTVISVNGNPTNNYTAILPKTTPSGVTYYLEWTLNGSVYTFQKQTQVSIVKLNCATVAAGSFAVTTPDATQNQSLAVSMYNEDFQPASATDTDIVAYGSGVFYARVLPNIWQAGNSSKQDQNIQWDGTFTPDPADIKMTLELAPGSFKWWQGCPVVYAGQIFSTISNGLSTSVTFNIIWNGTQTTSYVNWNPGISSSSGGSQYLICHPSSQAAAGNGKATTMTSLTLAPATNLNVTYQGELQLSPSSTSVAYGDAATVNAFLSSVEFVPQQ
jgi:hypothetical protein